MSTLGWHDFRICAIEEHDFYMQRTARLSYDKYYKIQFTPYNSVFISCKTCGMTEWVLREGFKFSDEE